MPRRFTLCEYADIHFVYGCANGNAEEAVREYHRRFPARRLPDAQVFVNTHQQFRTFGLRNGNEQNRPNRANGRRILNYFDRNPQASVRGAAGHLNLNRSTVWRTLRTDKRKAFHLQPVQHLHPEDPPRREAFCQWFLREQENNQVFCKKILWTDEATFTRAGVVNTHNLHVWGHENPHETWDRSFQNQFKVNVWAGIINDQVCGPHIFPERLNAVHFHQFLENDLINLLEDVPLETRLNHWIQLDGAPPHYGRIVQEWLNENYPER